jgi:hypothetical protein
MVPVIFNRLPSCNEATGMHELSESEIIPGLPTSLEPNCKPVR